MRFEKARQAFEIAGIAALFAVGLLSRWAKYHWWLAPWSGTCEPLVPLTNLRCGIDVVCLLGGGMIATIVAIVWCAIGIARWRAARNAKE